MYLSTLGKFFFPIFLQPQNGGGEDQKSEPQLEGSKYVQMSHIKTMPGCRRAHLGAQTDHLHVATSALCFPAPSISGSSLAFCQ